jgi:hypothetical protein
VRSMCGSCDQFSARGDETLHSTASSATAIPTRASARARCVCAPRERMQHATDDTQHPYSGHSRCGR